MCEQGQTATEFYVVMSGSVSVKCFVPAVESNMTLNTLSAGASFGQLGLINGSTVRAVHTLYANRLS